VFAGCQLDHAGTGAGVSTDRGTPDARRPPDTRGPTAPPPADAASAGGELDAATGTMPGPALDAGGADTAAPEADAAAPDAGTTADAASDLPGTGGVGTTSVLPCPADDDLALCLRFEGRLTDESPVPLAIRGRADGFVPGPSGLAAELGRDSQLGVAETPRLDSATVTLEVLVNPHAIGDRMTVVENPGQYALVILGSGSAMCSGTGGYALEPEAVRAGRWTRLRCVFDGQSVRLWVDGRQAAQGPSQPLNTGRALGLRIGWDDLPARPFIGLVDELRVWRGVRAP
jgi:hypothetical protein